MSKKEIILLVLFIIVLGAVAYAFNYALNNSPTLIK
jgi:uncharacterized protein YpmB